MRAAIATAVDAPLSISERNVPEPGPGEVLVRITACGVCFSDLNLVRGHYSFARFPVVPGHEITGTVAAVGPTSAGRTFARRDLRKLPSSAAFIPPYWHWPDRSG